MKSAPTAPRPASYSTRFYDDLLGRVRLELLQEGQPGKRLPSERHLAQRFGVSNVTIARILHDLQEDGVLHRVPSKGTFLANSAEPESSARPAETEIRGEAAPERFTSRRHAEVQSAANLHLWIIAAYRPEDAERNEDRWTLRATGTLERSVQRGGGKTMLTNLAVCGDCNAELEKALSRDINAIILVGDAAFQSDNDLRRFLFRCAMATGDLHPTVGCINLKEDDWPFLQVGCSEEVGVYRSVEHLVSQGHTEIAYLVPAIRGDEWLNWVELRVKYFHRAIECHGGRISGHIVRSEESCDDGATAPYLIDWQLRSESAVRQVLHNPDFAAVTAVIAANDSLARVFLSRAGEAGRSVPGDYSVVGFDDSAWGSAFGLTTVHVPVEEMATAAVEIVLERLGKPKGNETYAVKVAPTLLLRETTGRV